jgi:hypothetical protein
LSKLRAKISFVLFRDIFEGLILKFEPKRILLKGLRVYATDGLQLTLPRAEKVIELGYTGRAVSKYRESYLPRMYLTHCYDVLSGVTKTFRYSPRPDEIRDAEVMIKHLEKKSVSLYDRLYISSRLIRAHQRAGNFFVFRCRRKGVLMPIQEFYKSKKKITTFTLDGMIVSLIKVYNPKLKRHDVFATNLPQSWVKKTIIGPLYKLRWEVENSFRELTTTVQLQQWHSKSMNGILQELYASFWLINFTKIQMNLRMKKAINPLLARYQKPNFKVILNHVIDVFRKILNKIRGVLNDIAYLIKLTTERRKRYSRKYPRQIRGPASPYPYNNTVRNLK